MSAQARKLSKAHFRRRVLIVDDHMWTRAALEEFLEGYGYATTFAKNGAEALALLTKIQVDLIILDLEMPLMNGFDFLEAKQNLAAPLARIPVIVVSAASVTEFIRLPHVEAAFRKPIQLLDLLAAVDRTIGPGTLS